MFASGADAMLFELGFPVVTRSRSRKQITRFLFVGGNSVAIDLLCYSLLLGSMDRGLAKGISYTVGVLVGFAGNKLWTFESKGKSFSEPTLYVFVYGITLVLNIGINSFVCESLSSRIQSERTTQLLAFLIATGVTTILNFLGLKYLAFRQSQMVTAQEH